MTKSPGVEVLPSMKPRASNMALRSRSMSGLPQIMMRSSSRLKGGSPRSALSLPFSISVVMRPWLRKGSRVTVG